MTTEVLVRYDAGTRGTHPWTVRCTIPCHHQGAVNLYKTHPEALAGAARRTAAHHAKETPTTDVEAPLARGALPADHNH